MQLILHDGNGVGIGDVLSFSCLPVWIFMEENMNSQYNTHPNHNKNSWRLKSRKHKDLLQSKSAFFSHIFWIITMIKEYCTCLFYTVLEDGCIFRRRFWIEPHWTQASLIDDTAFCGWFDLIKSDKFRYKHFVTWRWPGQRQWTEYFMAISLDYRRKKNVNNQYNTHPKHSEMMGNWNCTNM